VPTLPTAHTDHDGDGDDNTRRADRHRHADHDVDGDANTRRADRHRHADANRHADDHIDPACAATPIPAAHASVGQKAFLMLKDKAPDDAKDQLQWKWIKGSSTAKADFGAPLTSMSYQLCIYNGVPIRILDATIPAAASAAPATRNRAGRTRPTASTIRTRTSRPTASSS